MKFPPSLLDDIRARLPVSQVVGRRVALKKAGREWKGLSPFKTEKTPSFFVNDQKGFYHCFASGEHGDIFKFVMATEGLTFPEAVERLAEEAGVPMPRREFRAADRAREDERTRLYALLEASATFFEQCLAGAPGANARGYIEHKRGLTRQTIARFRLGYAPAGRNALKEHLGKLGYASEEMVTSGMLIGGDDIPVAYDRFRNRVMFPITDLKDRIIAFGGRALDADAPAKYLNSPETPLFHKGHILYHAAKARAAAHDKGRVIAVEGYMDVVALAEAGFVESVAPLGTALTEDQVKLLWRMSAEPILCFDGDGAGRKAAFRAVETVMAHLKPGTSVRFAFLPDGLDPDDLIRQDGAAAMEAVLAATRSLADVLWDRESAGGDWSTPERRAKLEQQVMALVARIEDPAVRGHYAQNMRDRFAKLWGGGGGHWQGGGRNGAGAAGGSRSWAGNGGQRQNSRQPPGGPLRRGQTFQQRGASPGMPVPAQVPSSSLRQSRLAAATPGQADLPPREALLIRTLLNHPWLIEEQCEAVARLDFASRTGARMRDALLELQAQDIPLDSRLLRAQLTELGLDKVVALIERANTHRGDRFAEPDADRATVDAGWRHAVRLHESQLGLRRALEGAERAWLSEPSEETLARITEIKRLLARPMEMGDGGEATGTR